MTAPPAEPLGSSAGRPRRPGVAAYAAVALLAVLATACPAPPPAPEEGAPFEAPELLTVGVEPEDADGRLGPAAASANGARFAFVLWNDEQPGMHSSLYVRDRDAGTTERIERVTDGSIHASGIRLSSDGRHLSWVVEGFDEETGGTAHELFVRDLDTGLTESWIPEYDGPRDSAVAAVVSPDGGTAVVRTPSPGRYACMVRDLTTGEETSCAGHSAGYTTNSVVSANGRYVIYRDNAIGQDPSEGVWYRWDRVADERTILDASALLECCGIEGLLSDDGRYFAAERFVGDHDDPLTWDHFEIVHADLSTGATSVFSVGEPGPHLLVSMSAEGSLVEVSSWVAAGGGVPGSEQYTTTLWQPLNGATITVGEGCHERTTTLAPDLGARCHVTTDQLAAQDTDDRADYYLVPIPEFP